MAGIALLGYDSEGTAACVGGAVNSGTESLVDCCHYNINFGVMGLGLVMAGVQHTTMEPLGLIHGRPALIFVLW